MIQITQRFTRPPQGDCLRACVCSILEVEDVDAVPNFGELDGWHRDAAGAWQRNTTGIPLWWTELRRFLALAGHRAFQFVHDKAGSAWGAHSDEGDLWIAVIKSPSGGDWLHCVVANPNSGRVVWDPQPDQSINVTGRPIHDEQIAHWIALVRVPQLEAVSIDATTRSSRGTEERTPLEASNAEIERVERDVADRFDNTLRGLAESEREDTVAKALAEIREAARLYSLELVSEPCLRAVDSLEAEIERLRSLIGDTREACACNCHDPDARRAMNMRECANCGECCAAIAKMSDEIGNRMWDEAYVQGIAEGLRRSWKCANDETRSGVGRDWKHASLAIRDQIKGDPGWRDVERAGRPCPSTSTETSSRPNPTTDSTCP